MAWQDRVQQAAYTSPTGVRIEFDYEDVSRSVTRKTSAYEFADADGTYIQDLGSGSRRYPLRLFFWGTNYDLQAAAFEAALLERGVGKLEHPIYGTVDVVPFGDISRRDDLKTGANQAILEVTFWATIGLVYPAGQLDLAADTRALITAFNAAQALEFADGLGDLDPLGLIQLADTYNALLDGAESGLRAIADTQDNVSRQFDAVSDSINRGIDVLVQDPLTLAFQTSILIQAPARALTAIEARLDAYSSLAASVFTPTSATGGVPATEQPLDNVQLRTTDLYASTYVSGSAVSAINAEFTTRPQAIESAEDLLAQLEAASLWRDAAYGDSGIVDTGAAYQGLQSAVVSAVAFLIQVSFTLKPERRIVLDRNRTIIDLAAELYGSVDDVLDLLIASNDLSGDELFELKQGREIVYYV